MWVLAIGHSVSVVEDGTTPLSTIPPIGLHFIHLETLTINQNKVTQTIDLVQYGLKMHLVPDSTPGPMNITIGVSLSGNFKSPKNTTLVSALYYIKTSTDLLKPAILEIEHCAGADTDDKTLSFGKADTKVNSLPYVFEILSDGSFSEYNSWGSIKMSRFSLTGIFVESENASIDYLAYLLSLHRKGSTGIYRVSLVALRDLGAHKEVYLLIAYCIAIRNNLYIGCEERTFRVDTNFWPIYI